MRTSRVVWASVSLTLLAFLLTPAAAQAAACTVMVGATSYPTITQAAAAQTGPSTIKVTGTCTENVNLNDARSITITAGVGGATIVGPLDQDTFDISVSQDIRLVNLEITGTFSTTPNGGGAGVFVTEASDVRIIRCHIHNNQVVGVNASGGSQVRIRDTIVEKNTPNDGVDVFANSNVDLVGTTIQNNGDPVIGSAGVFVGRNSVVNFHQTNLVQNNANVGIEARIQSTVAFDSGQVGQFTTVQGNLTNGVMLEEGSHLQVTGMAPHLIQGNGTACPLSPTCGGIFATQDSHVDLGTAHVSGNHGSGIAVVQGSNVRLRGSTVTNNTGDGIHIQWLSIGDFLAGNTISGNGGASVFCNDNSLAIGDLTHLSKVQCEEIDGHNGQEYENQERPQ